MKPGLSAIIVVYNQANLLSNCLKSIKKLVDEIIILDLESTEDIASIAASFGAKYYKHKKVAIVEEVRQASLKYATYEYVLFLDPDESIGVELAQDLKSKVLTGHYDYFRIPRANYIFGKWVKHSRWWPDFQVRVFRQGKVSWGQNLHAEAAVAGLSHTYEMDEHYAIHHDNYRNLDEYIEKNMRYAKADALERVKAGNDLSLSQATKLSVSELISRFFVGEGYKDGSHGLILAILQSFYYFMVYAYYWEAKKYAEIEIPSELKSFPRTWFSHGLSEVLHWDRATTPIKIIKAKLVRRMIA